MIKNLIRNDSFRTGCLLVCAVVPAVVVGGFFHMIGKSFWPIVLAAIPMGFVLAFMLARLVLACRLKRAVDAIVVGAVTGVLSYAAPGYFNYLHFRNQMSIEFMSIVGNATPEQSDAAVDKIIEECARISGPFGYLICRIKWGMAIVTTKEYRESEENLSSVETAIVIFLELFIVVFLTVWKSYVATFGNFCDYCKRWFVPLFRANIPAKIEAEVIQGVKSGDFSRLPAYFDSEEFCPRYVEVDGCDECHTQKPIVSVVPYGKRESEYSRSVDYSDYMKLRKWVSDAKEIRDRDS